MKTCEYKECVETSIIDNFLDDYKWFRKYCDMITYKDEVNPVDGVVYPGISIMIPLGITSEIFYKLEKKTKSKIINPLMFLRMTKEGERVPHQAHNDATMGTHGFVLYLNRPEHEDGGTSFVQHVDEGMEYGPENDSEQEIWERDNNIPDKWKITQMADMKSNRAILFDTMKMHRPEPPLGFGSGNKESRLVLVCFFSVVSDD